MNGGTPKWMVDFMENSNLKWMNRGTRISGNLHIWFYIFWWTGTFLNQKANHWLTTGIYPVMVSHAAAPRDDLWKYLSCNGFKTIISFRNPREIPQKSHRNPREIPWYPPGNAAFATENVPKIQLPKRGPIFRSWSQRLKMSLTTLLPEDRGACFLVSPM